MADPTRGFVSDGSKGVENWCGIVLFGRNVASYKFALAKSLLEVATQGHEEALPQPLTAPVADPKGGQRPARDGERDGAQLRLTRPGTAGYPTSTTCQES